MRPYDVLIYGAYGYTGKLITRACGERGINALLSGRDRNRLREIAGETDYPFEACGLGDRSALEALLRKVSVIIHCAGPFAFTAPQMAEACLAAGTHYVDITGEYTVFEALSRLDERAKEKRIVIMPGAGFDVVPSDCLARHLKGKLPAATLLQLAFAIPQGGVSRGTARTVIESLGHGSMVRSNGHLRPIALGEKALDVDFGPFRSTAMCIPWGDISTAWRSTGIPNIEVYIAVSKRFLALARMSRWFNWLMRSEWVRAYLRRKLDARPAGPDDKRLLTGVCYLWGRVADAHGNTAEVRLQTRNGYWLTARTATLVTAKLLSGNVRHGYYTPAMYFGEGLIMEVEGSQWMD
jgi:short subunit dehydrogenase-like uncharacterized protein